MVANKSYDDILKLCSARKPGLTLNKILELLFKLKIPCLVSDKDTFHLKAGLSMVCCDHWYNDSLYQHWVVVYEGLVYDPIKRSEVIGYKQLDINKQILIDY